MNKFFRRYWPSILIGFVIGSVGQQLFVRLANAEPFPEDMKSYPQAYECYTFKMENGRLVKKDTWVITWRMATEWFPELGDDNYIVFQGRRRTVLPTPKEYKCTAWVEPPKKKGTKK